MLPRLRPCISAVGNRLIGLCYLWLAARAELIARGFDELTLWVLTGNTRAIHFYRNAGLAAEPESVRSLSRGGRILTEIRYRSHL